MSKMSRDKGKAGEREAANEISRVTGMRVIRRVRNRAGESDLIGVPGWDIEVKRYARISQADADRFWGQATDQAEIAGKRPLLVYRQNAAKWMARWPLNTVPGMESAGPEHWVEGSIETWFRAVLASMEPWKAVQSTDTQLGGGAAGEQS